MPSTSHEVLRSPGEPLDTPTRVFMEARFGHDFRKVRVHADARAAESARAINAPAYAVGRDVVFGAGQYRPQTGAGRRLLAHELAHVSQQSDAAAASRPALGVGRDAMESEARVAAGRVDAGASAGGLSRAAVQTVQRAEPGESLGALDNPIIDPFAGYALGGEMRWQVLRELLRGAVTETRAAVAAGRDETIFARFRGLKPNDILQLQVGYTEGFLRGVVSPLTDLFDLLKLGHDVQRAAIEWFLTRGPALIQNFGQRQPQAQALLAQLDRVNQRARAALAKMVLNTREAMPQIEALLTKLREAVLAKARQAGRRISGAIFGFFELPWYEFGKQVGVVVGMALVEVLMAVFTEGIGNALRHIGRLVVRGTRLLVGEAMVIFRALGQATRQLLDMVRGLRRGVLALFEDLASDMEKLFELAERFFEETASALGPRLTTADGVATDALMSQASRGPTIAPSRAWPTRVEDLYPSAKPAGDVPPVAVEPAAPISPVGEVAPKSPGNGEPPTLPQTPRPVPKGLSRISDPARRWIEGQGLTEQAARSLGSAGDDINAAVNRFYDVAGFDHVFKDYLAGDQKQEGARFVMRFALGNFDGGAKAAMAFEMPGLTKVVGAAGNKLSVEPTRYLDLWVAGTKFEFKSVMEVASSLVTGRRAGEFGQFQKDLIYASAGARDPAELLAQFDRLRWVFDSRKMAASGARRDDVVRMIGDELFGRGIFKHHPNERELRAALDKIIVFWP